MTVMKRISKSYSEVSEKEKGKEFTLLQQEFVKDPKQTIEQYLKAQNKELTVTAFRRFTLNAE